MDAPEQNKQASLGRNAESTAKPQPPASCASKWLKALKDHQDQLEEASQLRSLRPLSHCGDAYHVQDASGNKLINLSSNDYLAIANHPRMLEAASAATFSAGGKASRLAGGDRPDIQALETRFAEFKQAEAALLFPTGYMANLAAMSCLTRPINSSASKNLICMDKYCHASLIDGAKLSEQRLRTYPHGPQGFHKLKRLLADYKFKSPEGQAFIVTDSLFSMDGDAADLKGLEAIALAYSAILIVDEAHGTGLYGDNGSGLSEHLNVKNIPITISTASKAMGSLGGLITGPKVMINHLINHGRSLIYTTSVPPSQVATIDCAISLIQEEPWRRERVLNIARQVRVAIANNQHIATIPGDSPIIPLITGSAASALKLADALHKQGFLATAIRPPTVAPNLSRVRLSLRADIPDHEIKKLITYLNNHQLVGE